MFGISFIAVDKPTPALPSAPLILAVFTKARSIAVAFNYLVQFRLIHPVFS